MLTLSTSPLASSFHYSPPFCEKSLSVWNDSIDWDQSGYSFPNVTKITETFTRALCKKSFVSSRKTCPIPSLIFLLKKMMITSNHKLIKAVQRALFKQRGYFSRLISFESWEEWTENRTALGRVCSAYREVVNNSSVRSDRLIQRLDGHVLSKANREAEAILGQFFARRPNQPKPLSRKVKKVDRYSSCLKRVFSGALATFLTKQPFPLFLGLGSCLPVGLAAEKIGSEFRVNMVTNFGQQPDIAALPNGNFVVVFKGVGACSPGGIYAKLYDHNGSLLKGEFSVSSHYLDQGRRPIIAALKNNNFVIVWTGNRGGYGKIYDAEGNLVGSEFQIYSETTDRQTLLSVTSLRDGGFIVVWKNYNDCGSGKIQGQFYNSLGKLLDNRVVFNDAYHMTQLTVDQLKNGNLVVSWTDRGFDGSGLDVYAQLLDSDGTAIGSQIYVSNTSGSNLKPAIAVLSNGHFVVIWGSIVREDRENGIYAHLFDKEGNKIGSPFFISSYRSNYAISDLSKGSFVVAWDGVYAQLFDAMGGELSEEFFASSDDGQEKPLIAQLANRNFVIIWESNRQDGSDLGISAQLFSQSISPMLSLSRSSIIFDRYRSLNVIDNRLALSDVDSPLLEGAQVILTNNFVKGEDVLEFTQQSGVNGTYDGLTGTLRLTGLSSIANYQTVLRSIIYLNSSPHPIILPRTVSFTVSDGYGPASIPVNVTVNFATNSPPLVRNAIALQNAQVWRRFELLLPSTTFQDPDGDIFKYSVQGLPYWLKFNSNTRLFSGTPPFFRWGGENINIKVSAQDSTHVSTTDFDIEVSISEMLQDLLIYYTALGVSIVAGNAVVRLIRHIKRGQQDHLLSSLYHRYTKDYSQIGDLSSSQHPTARAIKQTFFKIHSEISRKTGTTLKNIHRQCLIPLATLLKENPKSRIFDYFDFWPMVEGIVSTLQEGIYIQSVDRHLLVHCQALQHLLDFVVLHETRNSRPMIQKDKQKVWQDLQDTIARLYPKNAEQAYLKFLLEQAQAAIVSMHDDQNLKKIDTQLNFVVEILKTVTAPPWGVAIAWRRLQQIPRSWYIKLLYIRQLIPYATQHIEGLREIQRMAATCQDGYFLYGVVSLLGHLARSTQIDNIKSLALQEGISNSERGLGYYASAQLFTGKGKQKNWIRERALSELLSMNMQGAQVERKEYRREESAGSSCSYPSSQLPDIELSTLHLSKPSISSDNGKQLSSLLQSNQRLATSSISSVKDEKDTKEGV